MAVAMMAIEVTTSRNGNAAIDLPDARFKAAGTGAALTVIPTRLAGTPMPKVGDAIALLLEQRGMTNLETSTTAFAPPEGTDLPATSKAFGEFVRGNQFPTEYVMFTEFMGTREKGITEVRAVVVNRQGDVMWTFKQAKGDAEFDRVKPHEPMQCCVMIVDGLRPVLKLTDGKRELPPGKIAERWRLATGSPDKTEMERIEQRGKAFKKAAATATLVVYPAHAGSEFSPASATNLASVINEKRLTKAAAADTGPRFEIVRDMNEQRVLWSMANGFSDYVKKNPPNEDYVMFADYVLGSIVCIHFAICNKKGELVIVDYQNDHHGDFKAINPKSREDCDRLVIKRLQGYCK
jgi:hypothetical protein